MSVNFEKNKSKILDAWNKVINDKISTDWALFGYEGQSNDLKVVGTGEGGLEELGDELNSGKIMYAFVRVDDPKTSLTKFVLINWQGEGAPVLRKGTCANHIRDVAKILNGAHLTINARVEDDVEKERILHKVSAVGSAYSFKDHKFIEEGQRGLVGTAYSRVNPAKEINTAERDNFWKKEEEEEKRRIEIERERKKLEMNKSEEERRKREQKEHQERERSVAEYSLKATNSNATIQSPIHPLSPTYEPTEVTVLHGMTQAELMRQQRNQEAKELIGSRVGTAKAIFAQNTASGQMQTKAAPVKPVRNSIAQRINSLNNPQHHVEDPPKVLSVTENVINSEVKESHNLNKQHDHIAQNINEIVQFTNGNSNKEFSHDGLKPADSFHQQLDENEDNDLYSTIKRSPHTKSSSQAATPIEEKEKPLQDTNIIITTTTSQLVSDAIEQNENELIPDERTIFQDMLDDIGLRAKALYDYQAADESEITFDPGDIITHIDQIDEGWWQGLAPDGSYGLFPANYVELIKD